VGIKTYFYFLCWSRAAWTELDSPTEFRRLGGKENGQKRVKKGQKRGILQLKPQLLVWPGNRLLGLLGLSKNRTLG